MRVLDRLFVAAATVGLALVSGSAQARDLQAHQLVLGDAIPVFLKRVCDGVFERQRASFQLG